MDRFVVISGCSGGGKSALLAELARRGYATVEEPGRRIVKEELASGGVALPWLDATAFVRRAVAMADADWVAACRLQGWVFFDRGLIDAASALQQLTNEAVPATIGPLQRYHRRVFLTPPWPEIYLADVERRHTLDVAIAEYRRLLSLYPALGYKVMILPKVSVSERADLLLQTLAE